MVMADIYSPVEVILDANTRTRRVNVGGILQFPDINQQINLEWGGAYLFTARVYKGVIASPFAFPAGTAFLWGADHIYEPNADPIMSQNSQFHITGDAAFDPAVGALCWRADLATSALKTILQSTTNPSLVFHSYLWATPPTATSTIIIVAKWDITIWMPAVDPVTVSPVAPIWGDGSYERRKNGRTQVLFPDGKWRSRIGIIQDGQPAETWGDPED